MSAGAGKSDRRSAGRNRARDRRPLSPLRRLRPDLPRDLSETVDFACKHARPGGRGWRNSAAAIQGSLTGLADPPPRARPIGLASALALPPPSAAWLAVGHGSRSRRIPALSSAATARAAKEQQISVLRNLESRIEGLVEGVFSRAFSSEAQPVELARKLAKEMDAYKTASVVRVYVPNEYTVYLSKQDRAKLEGYERSLEQELSGHLLEHARRRSMTCSPDPTVEFKTDERLRLGEFGIQTRLVKPPAARGGRARQGGGGPHDGLLGGPRAHRGATKPRAAAEPSSSPARWSRSMTAATCSRARARRSAAPSRRSACSATQTSNAVMPSCAAPRPATGRSLTSVPPMGSR